MLSWALMSRPACGSRSSSLASYVFYAAASPIFCLLLAGITLWNHLAAVTVVRCQTSSQRRWVTGIAVAGNLLTLGVFKYYSFFAQAVARVLESVSLGVPFPLLTIALPVGISFFTFQAISYTVDVSRGLIEPASLIDVAVYLSFFPHLVAGPIVRAREFLPQLARPRDPEHVAVSAGLFLIGMGLVKKVVIADYLGRTVVDPVFAVPQAYHAPDVLLAGYAYAAQIYCDFSGYTDIAIGLALLMGFVFPQNFHSPYRATGFRDFWRRWHMTLSRFLRDFLYIPLGGNRHGAAEDLPQPDDHDGAGRPVARGRVDVRALGRLQRPRPGARARLRRADQDAHVAALVRHLPSDRVRLDPVPGAGDRDRLGLPQAASGRSGRRPCGRPR